MAPEPAANPTKIAPQTVQKKQMGRSTAKKPVPNKRIEAIIEDPERENEKGEGSTYVATNGNADSPLGKNSTQKQ